MSVSPRSRRVAGLFTALAVGTVVGITPVNAADPDITAPVFLGATITHEVIDVVDGPVNVTLRVEAEDLDSGINPTSFTIDPDHEYGNGIDPVKAKVMTLVSGDHHRGIYEATFTFPELILNGNWTFNAVIRDNVGNANYDYNGSATFGVLQRTTTVHSSPDREAPLVTTNNSTTLVDVTDGPVEIKLTAEAHDSGIGFPAAETIMFTSGFLGGSRYLNNVSTNPNIAHFEETVTIPQYTVEYDPRGTYKSHFGSVRDANGNASPSYVSAGTVTVATRPLRAKRPDLVVEGLNVRASWAAQTDPLGILEYEVELKSSELMKTIKTTALEVVSTGLSAGTYTACVRARNQLGWGEWTTPSAPVTYTLAPMASSTPTISGTVKVGETLTANPGAWTPETTLSYRWMADGVAVSGGSGSTLVLSPLHAGKAITVRVAGSKPGYVTASKTSGATAAVAKGTLVGAVPTITGTARVGATLTASAGSWSPAPVALTYQWYRSGVAITGATASTYMLVTDDLGKTITVKTTARKTGYNVSSKTSRPTAAVTTNLLTAARPVIVGSPKADQTLTVNTGTWSPTGVTFTYQWYRNGSAISGATASFYKAVSADIGSGLTVRVTGRKSGYLAKGSTSIATSPVTR